MVAFDGDRIPVAQAADRGASFPAAIHLIGGDPGIGDAALAQAGFRVAVEDTPTLVALTAEYEETGCWIRTIARKHVADFSQVGGRQPPTDERLAQRAGNRWTYWAALYV
ncbi:hypothetical protein Misp02_63290 [Microtetraspora sp. NBRC 16547]|nr:hypothetical protein Misp02_63290 [Microtetraspora sp. NBRC 16547]